MVDKKRIHPKEKVSLHPRNKHRERYNFKELTKSCSELAPFVRLNDYNDESIDFSNPQAVLMLNKAILKHFYGIKSWTIPTGYLCPPVPGRADYIHYIADLLGKSNNSIPPIGSSVKCLDIGVGANCIYPLIGSTEYGWSFIGSDIDRNAVNSANQIISENLSLKGNVSIRLQNNPNAIFSGIIEPNEFFDITICNPPFHASLKDAKEGSRRKISSLKKKQVHKPVLNFGGQSKELFCKGGEEQFIKNMIAQSKNFSKNCLWFTTLVSKGSNLIWIYKALKRAEARQVETIQMSQGTKISRLVAWTFLSVEQQQKWKADRW